MSYVEARKKVLRALRIREFSHEARRSIEVKNLLFMGEISPEQVIQLIKSSTSANYSCSEHHFIKGIDVHVIRCQRWYIKFYFLNPDTVFISVHQ